MQRFDTRSEESRYGVWLGLGEEVAVVVLLLEEVQTGKNQS